MEPFSLDGKKGLIVGIANDLSIAYGCAKVLKALGATLAVTYASSKSEQYVKPLAEELGAAIFMKMDVRDDGQLDAVFSNIKELWGELDFVIHSIAFANKVDLQAKVIDCSREGFLEAMDISCYSLIKLSNLAAPLMKNGGSILAMSYIGSERVVDNYGIMGPIKAALESTTKYLASELGYKGIRVNAISSGPIKTRAAGGIAQFDSMLTHAHNISPLQRVLTPDDVGNLSAFLTSNAAICITGEVIHVDCGYHIMG